MGAPPAVARPPKGSKFRQAARPVVSACLRPFLLSLRSSALLVSLFVLRCLFPSAVSRLTLSMTEFEPFGRIKIGQAKTPVLFLPLCRFPLPLYFLFRSGLSFTAVFLSFFIFSLFAAGSVDTAELILPAARPKSWLGRKRDIAQRRNLFEFSALGPFSR